MMRVACEETDGWGATWDFGDVREAGRGMWEVGGGGFGVGEDGGGEGVGR